VSNKDWEYGGQYQINVQQFPGQALRVSLVAAVSSTHGNTMGGRTIFPGLRALATLVPSPRPQTRTSRHPVHQLFILMPDAISRRVYSHAGTPGKLASGLTFLASTPLVLSLERERRTLFLIP